MLDLVRSGLHKVITTKTGDRFTPVRLPKDLARRVNTLLGEPICSRQELERRRAARAKLEELRRTPPSASSDAGAHGAHGARQSAGAAPVVVYFEKDRNHRLLGRIEELLGAKGIAFTTLDVAGDEVAKDYVMRTAHCKEDELPIVFIAGTPVGGYNDLVDWDVSGKLAKAVRGEA